MSAQTSEPLLLAPVRSVDVGRRRIARVRVREPELAEVVQKRIFERVLGPHDARKAEIVSQHLLLLPFHRFEIEAGDSVLRMGSMRSGNARMPLPFQTSKRENVVLWIAAREAIPLRIVRRIGMAPLLLDATAFGALDVPMSECTLDAEASMPEVQADVPRERAEEQAKLTAKVGLGPGNAVFGVGGIETHVAKYDVVSLPTMIARYTYQGEADPRGGTFSVGVSAYSGKPIWEEHPNVGRSALGKFRKALTFG